MIAWYRPRMATFRQVYLRLFRWSILLRHCQPSIWNLWNYVSDHPKFAGLLAFVALAVTFSPKASVMATWICLFLAWVLAVAMISGTTSLRASRYRVVYTAVLAVFLGSLFIPFGWWLTEPQPTEIASKDVLNSLKEKLSGLFNERLETKVFRKGEQNQPPTLLGLFASDFPSVMKFTHDKLGVKSDDGRVTAIKSQVYADFPAKTHSSGTIFPLLRTL